MTTLSTERPRCAFLTTALLAATLIPAGPLSAADRPNIVIVMADDN